MAKTDSAAAHRVLHVKLEIQSCTGVNDWCNLKRNDGKGEWEEDMALKDSGGSRSCLRACASVRGSVLTYWQTPPMAML